MEYEEPDLIERLGDRIAALPALPTPSNTCNNMLINNVIGSFHTKSAAPRTGLSQIKIIFCIYVKVNEKLPQPKFFVAITSVA
jgi:hypothetical protein